MSKLKAILFLLFFHFAATKVTGKVMMATNRSVVCVVTEVDEVLNIDVSKKCHHVDQNHVVTMPTLDSIDVQPLDPVPDHVPLN